MKIYYQGVPGAYSHEAAEYFAQHTPHKNQKHEYIACQSFDELFDKISGDIESFGCIPVENSYAGTVHRNYDLMVTHHPVILAEYYHPIRHYLLGKNTSFNQITQAFSHEQAVMQCTEFLNKHNIQGIHAYDTAGSAQNIANNPQTHTAAIASKKAGEIYNLDILSENIQDDMENRTRFLLVSKDNSLHPKEGKKTSLVFETQDIPSALYKSLGAFATRNINLHKIESRPSPEKNFNYLFYLDIEASEHDPNTQGALEELSLFAKNIHILGSY